MAFYSKLLIKLQSCLFYSIVPLHTHVINIVWFKFVFVTIISNPLDSGIVEGEGLIELCLCSFFWAPDDVDNVL